METYLINCLWRPRVFLLVLSAFFVCNSVLADDPQVKLLEDYTTFMTLANSPLGNMSKDEAWKKAIPQVKSITIKSSADGSMEPALFYNSGSERKKPLLLVLHSWSADYIQHFSIPYGAWAVENDWVFIHPSFRGEFNNPKACGSELAIQDVLDALEYAKNNAKIDDSRVYLAGFSGGGMMTLNMVGRYPHLWTAAVAWVPVYDLVAWYETTKHATHDYSRDIERCCGGKPLPGTSAATECAKRSPKAYLANARGEAVRIYIATGIRDQFVPPAHSLRAFNNLVDEPDRFTEAEIAEIVDQKKIPAGMDGDYSDKQYTAAGKKLLLEKTSNNVTLKIFDGTHDVIYNAGLLWLSKQNR